MHAQYDEAFARHDRRLREAWQVVADGSVERGPWEDLGDAARAIEADSVLRGEFQLAYLAAKLDAAVSAALAGSWPPAESQALEVRDLVLLFHVPRVAWERRRRAATSAGGAA
jgi:hypothetical protein